MIRTGKMLGGENDNGEEDECKSLNRWAAYR